MTDEAAPTDLFIVHLCTACNNITVFINLRLQESYR